MQALISQSHFYLTVFYVTAAACFAPEWIGTFFQNPEKGAQKRDRGSYALLLLAMFAGVLLAFWFVNGGTTTTIAWHPKVWFWIGIVLMVAGTAYRWYAIKVLGKFFTRSVATRAGQYVVDFGPYRLIRHPSYTGALVTMLGLGVAMTNWASLACVLAGSVVGYAWRMHVEEQALCAGLGQPYRDYMARTRRIVPYVW